jgi:hypothetical protein
MPTRKTFLNRFSLERATFVASAALLLAPLLCPVAMATAQNANPPKPVLNLPDPTPRPRDPHDIFSDDPTGAAQRQQANELHNSKRRAQVIATTDQLVQLAKQLRDDIAKNDPENPMFLNARNAEKIEKLAKSVREQMKSP